MGRKIWMCAWHFLDSLVAYLPKHIRQFVFGSATYLHSHLVFDRDKVQYGCDKGDDEQQ